ncbi:MAG: hypothetical protein D6690_07765 [Nitrospirae bacterium]|nr:MAG: hypothetical protein D6690_07765 [Nitrospirota bacterium]
MNGRRFLQRKWWMKCVALLGLLVSITVGGVASALGDNAMSVLPKEEESDIVIVIKDKAFHVIKGGSPNPYHPLFLMEAGLDHIITIRNEDDVAHEFVSPYFRDVEVQLSGDATMVFPDDAAGFRIDPGKSVTLRFRAPELPKGQDVIQKLFWCDIHGKDPLSKMRGEIVLSRTQLEIE